MENKIIKVPKPIFDHVEASNLIRELRVSILELSDYNKRDNENFFQKLNNKINTIMYADLSNKVKIGKIIQFKNNLESQKLPPAKEYEIKRINEFLEKIIKPIISDLSELIRLGVESLPNEENELITNNKIHIEKDEELIPNKENLSELITNENNCTETNSEKKQIELGSNINSFELIPLNQNTCIPIEEKIKMNLSKEKIKNFFYRLSTCTNSLNNKPYLVEADVEHLLCQNFLNYSEEQVDFRMLNLNLNQKQYGFIYYFLYKFFSLNEMNRDGSKEKYAYFLKNNFTCFKDYPIDTLKSSIRNNVKLEKMDLFNNYK